MPFESKAQQGYMFMKHPKIANRWADKYGVPSNLPEHAKQKKRKNQIQAIKSNIKKY